MAGNGPPPKHPSARRRRNAAPALKRLPAEGRSGRAPAWPYGKPNRAASALWSSLWKTPQAVVWETHGLAGRLVVARYVQVSLMTRSLTGGVPMLAEARQLEDRLLMTEGALKRAGYEIATDELAERRESASSSSSHRERPRAFDPKLAVVDA